MPLLILLRYENIGVKNYVSDANRVLFLYTRGSKKNSKLAKREIGMF